MNGAHYKICSAVSYLSIMKLVVLIALFFTTNKLMSQTESWYMGQGMMLEFEDADVIDTKINDDLRVHDFFGFFALGSWITDANGQLLIYSNGVSVYNRDLQILPNGDSLSGDGRICQSSLIVPVPNESNKYFLFSVGKSLNVYRDLSQEHLIPNRLTYSIIDMNLDSGNGDIPHDQKNILLQEGSNFGMLFIQEKCNKSWVLTSDRSGISTYSVSDKTIESVNRGLFNDRLDPLSNSPPISLLRSSPNGQYVVAHIFDGENFLRLFQFNVSNGQLSDIGYITNRSFLEDGITTISFAFDPASRYIVSLEAIIQNGDVKKQLVRYELNPTSIDEILDSRRVIVDNYEGDLRGMYYFPTDSTSIIIHDGRNIGAIYDIDSENPLVIETIASFPNDQNYGLDFPERSFQIVDKTLTRLPNVLMDTTLCTGSVSINAIDFNADAIVINQDTLAMISLDEPGSYEISMITECFSDETTINISACQCDMYIPNSFRPSSVHGNDNFGAVSNCDWIQYDLSIYDRWGAKVFQSFDPKNTWDGSWNDRELQSGIYTYSFSYHLIGQDFEVSSGTINLVR